MLLAGCDATSDNTAPTPGRTTSVAATAAGLPATAAVGGGFTAAPAPPPEAGAPAPPPDAGAPVTAPPGTPAATTAAPAAAAFWDPCSLPDSEIAAAGLNAAGKSRLSDSTYPTWKMCKWSSADETFELVIASSDRTVDDLLAPGTYQDLRRTEYYGRQWIQYRSVEDTNKIACDIATPAEFGSIVFAFRTAGGKRNGVDTCAKGNEVGARLFRSLP
ncbi:hypothetical protein A5789_14380 [Nocardia sp. 852002-51101_SCH5132738]|nr:hypothetical protein A5789_14380 [Nocardia sp. 852002-51101_SCH5132738]OBB40624.1 hypothetical protein A5748_32735 [Nocardia sp. 852002-51244_SCH5132740]OBF84075.1 hypothetical protein A9X06_15615 [Mycobacterium sp. 852002-51759_SCH5129042]